MCQLSPVSRTQESVDNCLVSVLWCRAHRAGAHAALVLFPHFRYYAQRLRMCRRSLSLSQVGRVVRGVVRCSCKMSKRINMTSGGRVLWFTWNRRFDGERKFMLWWGMLGSFPRPPLRAHTRDPNGRSQVSPARETPHLPIYTSAGRSVVGHQILSGCPQMIHWRQRCCSPWVGRGPPDKPSEVCWRLH